MKRIIKTILIVAVIGLVTACSEETQPEPATTPVAGLTFSDQVQYHIQNDEYEEALVLVRAADQTDPVVLELTLATHLTYAHHLMMTGQFENMRENMPAALRHYRRVLQIDPENQKAKADIELIEGIYRSLDREIPQGIAE